nr:SH3 domain-containing protein [Desulfobacula sp.]
MTVSKGMAILIVFSFFLAPGAVRAEERLSVISSIANMRSGPGTEDAVLWQVEQYHPVIVVEKKGNWYKVKDYENDTAWLHNSLLGKVDSVVTVKDKSNVRSKPDAKSSIKFTVDKGVPFKVLEKKGPWIKIQHADGDIGWIHNTLVW